MHDLTGPKEENATWYCVIGDDHFNKDNVKCPNWIPDINGITPAEALKLYQNKPVPKKWFEKPSWQLIIAACITVLGGLFVAYVVFELGWNSTKEAPSPPKKTAVEEKSAAISDASIPKKIPSQTPPSKKTIAIVSQSSVSALNSNIFIGSNTGTVSQTVNNYPEPKPVPLKERLILCLNEIDKNVLSSLQSGTATIFEIDLEPYQLAELKRLYAEDVAHKYIPSLKVTDAYITLSGSYNKIQFELTPALLR